MNTLMTKKAYIHWKQTRGEIGEWKREDCAAADALIRHETLKNFEAYLKAKTFNKPTRDYLRIMVRAHFGSGETDTYLQSQKIYPSWI